eukprot:CAMPEP_0114576738 /NCGR_PEP_ID=MMETSP0125-20121206/1471_1 /TAXON_ID=485358 ORGANISM="Aristerostoma sp., Strain ATCC 50986" /NCGR_SAMPLE_ID=MMETSP0125 /ASSEMBLY_ACC=CAM_ASM_000245 /LENGTH=86 /DNA_ID=CAMNT_0001765495 /DNA_START=816 /DNA_END=1076 /DNA_ORIENTATION=+
MGTVNGMAKVTAIKDNGKMVGLTAKAPILIKRVKNLWDIFNMEPNMEQGKKNFVMAIFLRVLMLTEKLRGMENTIGDLEQPIKENL